MLTAKGRIPIRFWVWSWAPDDYMVKPFNPLELIARIKAMLRRRNASFAAVTFMPAAI
jgi:DNA-binding response OmpR family regulator